MTVSVLNTSLIQLILVPNIYLIIMLLLRVYSVKHQFNISKFVINMIGICCNIDVIIMEVLRLSSWTHRLLRCTHLRQNNRFVQRVTVFFSPFVCPGLHLSNSACVSRKVEGAYPTSAPVHVCIISVFYVLWWCVSIFPCLVSVPGWRAIDFCKNLGY